MLSKMKKSFIMGLSGILSLSLSFGTCASAYSNEDYKQMIQEHATCSAEKDRCSWKCWNAKGGITDRLPDFCGGDTIDSSRESFFPGCEAEYLECKQKALGNLSLTEKLKSWWNLRGKSSDEIGVSQEDFDNFLHLLRSSPFDLPMDNMVLYYKKIGSNDGKLFWLNMKVGSMLSDTLRAGTGMLAGIAALIAAPIGLGAAAIVGTAAIGTAVVAGEIVGVAIMHGMMDPKFKRIIRKRLRLESFLLRTALPRVKMDV